MSDTDAPVTPERISQYSWAFALTQSLAAACELRLFTHVAAGANTLDALARAAGASRRGVDILATALVAMGLLERRGSRATGTYTNAPDAERFLVEGKPACMAEFVVFQSQDIRPHWSRLTEVVRTGVPPQRIDDPKEGVPLWVRLVDGLFDMNYPAARVAGAELSRLHPTGPLRVLDVAAGSGVWGIGVLEVEPRARLVAFDLAETLERTKAFVGKRGLEERVELIAGNLRDHDFGERRHEAAILGHILHSEGEAHGRALLAKMGRALVPGGTIVIPEFLTNDEETGPLQGRIFGLNMLVHTSDGDSYSFATLRRWLEEAGFVDARLVEAPAPSPLVFATRA